MRKIVVALLRAQIIIMINKRPRIRRHNNVRTQASWNVLRLSHPPRSRRSQCNRKSEASSPMRCASGSSRLQKRSDARLPNSSSTSSTSSLQIANHSHSASRASLATFSCKSNKNVDVAVAPAEVKKCESSKAPKIDCLSEASLNWRKTWTLRGCFGRYMVSRLWGPWFSTNRIASFCSTRSSVSFRQSLRRMIRIRAAWTKTKKATMCGHWIIRKSS